MSSLQSVKVFLLLENAFAKLKAVLRKAAACSIADLWNTIGTAIEQVTPGKCVKNYFTAAGYDLA